MQGQASDSVSSKPVRKRRRVAAADEKQPTLAQEHTQQSPTNQEEVESSSDDAAADEDGDGDCISVCSADSSDSGNSQGDDTTTASTVTSQLAPQPRNTHLTHINDSTFYQYQVLLRPLTLVLSICRGVPTSEVQRLLISRQNNPQPLSLRLPELKATVLCMALLGGKLKRDDCAPLLALNQRMIRDSRQPPVIRVATDGTLSMQQGRGCRIQRDDEGAMRIKRRTLRTYWNKVNRALVALGHEGIPSQWKSEVGIFLDQLRLSKDEPVAWSAIGSSSGAMKISQDRELSPPPVQPDDGKAKETALSRVAGAARNHHLGAIATSTPGHFQPITLEQSIEELPDPAQAYRSAIATCCPSCDLKCNDYVQLLFHWVTQSCQNKKGLSSRKIWCAFCRCFLPLDTTSPGVLTKHHAECTYEWGVKSGFISAILADTSLPKKSKTRPKKHSGVFRDAPHAEYFRPCAITVPNFFALKAKETTISYSNTDNVIWYFCPDCVAGGGSSGGGSERRGSTNKTSSRPPTAGTLKKTFSIFRTPNALAQHYQSHLTQGGGQLGQRRLPLCQTYHSYSGDDGGGGGSHGWNCPYPACLFIAYSIAQRVNHLSKEHMIPLVVDRNGVAQRQAQLDESAGVDVVLWSPECAMQDGGGEDDKEMMFLTRGKTDMQKGHRLVKSSGEEEEEEETIAMEENASS